MRLIDADAIPFRDELKRLSVLDHDKYITAETLEYMLEHAPTADAVPVIRCKDCRYYEQTEDDDPYCHYLGFYQRDGWNWFCAGAERGRS